MLKITPTIFFFIISCGMKITSTSLPRVQIETDDFETLVQNYLFVDKTLYIEYFRLNRKAIVTVILRPEGWTKSSNLNMIEKFFEIEVDENGERLAEEKRRNKILFLGGNYTTKSNRSITLDPLKISNYTNSSKELGKRPVILLKLKTATGNSCEEIEENIKSCVRRVFRRHKYLLNSTKITGIDKLRNYLFGRITTTDLISSLNFLSEKLWQHFNATVHILIDDYDIPIISSYLAFGSQSNGQFAKMNQLLRKFYDGTFKGNIYRRSGLLAGVLPIDLNTSPENYYKFSGVETQTFYAYFGFTYREVQELFKKIGMPQEIDQRPVNSWYGNYGRNQSYHYSPRSLIRSLSRNVTLQPQHDTDTVRFALFDRAVSADKTRTMELIQFDANLGRIVDADFDLEGSKPIRWHPLDVDKILYMAGYLSPSAIPKPLVLRIPNQDMQHVFQTKALDWVWDYLAINATEFSSLLSSLGRSECHHLNHTFRKFLFNAANYYVTGELKNFYKTYTKKLKKEMASCADSKLVERIRSLAILVQSITKEKLELSKEWIF